MFSRVMREGQSTGLGARRAGSGLIWSICSGPDDCAELVIRIQGTEAMRNFQHDPITSTWVHSTKMEQTSNFRQYARSINKRRRVTPSDSEISTLYGGDQRRNPRRFTRTPYRPPCADNEHSARDQFTATGSVKTLVSRMCRRPEWPKPRHAREIAGAL